jgi:cation/acetate symporter
MARQPAGMYRRVAILFAGAFLAALVVLALLGHFGMPEVLIGVLLGGATLATYALVGLNAGTMEISEFHLAGRAVSAAANGMASAAAVMGGAIYLGLAGALSADLWTGAALTAGWSVGCLVLAVAVAPYFRKSAAFGVADFLGIRFDSPPVRVAAVAVVAAALLAALAAALATAAFVASLLFGIPGSWALVIVTAVVLASTVLGGMRAITLTAIVQYIVLAVAFLVPAAIASVADFRLPLPELTFGFALDEAARLAAARGDLAAPLAGIFLPIGRDGMSGLFATAFSVAAGVAALPHLVVRTAAVPGVDEARRTAGWTLLFLLVVALTAPAYAAFTELAILRDLAGTGLELLPAWVYSWGELGLVRICDADAASAIAVIEACRALPDFTGNLAASNFQIGEDALVLAAPAIFELPYVGSALIAVGAIAATIAAANALAFSLASAIGHDFYGGVINTRASAGRQLIVTRVIMAIAIIGASWIAANRPDDAYGLALAALSLSAGGLFPAVILAVWWKRSNGPGAFAGILAGSLATGAIVFEYRYPGILALGPIDPGVLGLNELTAAIVGVPIGFAVTAVVSLVTSAPSPDDRAMVDAIRRPGGTPFVQEIESR